MLVADGRVLTENLDHARVSDAELWSQLRSQRVQRLEQARAVVLEPTGDMSVLTGDGGIDAELLSGVRGVRGCAPWETALASCRRTSAELGSGAVLACGD